MRKELVETLKRTLGVLGPWRNEAPSVGNLASRESGTEVRLEAMPPETPQQSLRRMLQHYGHLQEGLTTEMLGASVPKDWIESPCKMPCDLHFALQVNTLVFLRDLVLTWDGFDRCSIVEVLVAGEPYTFGPPTEGDWKQTGALEGYPTLVPGQMVVVTVRGVDTAKVSLSLVHDSMKPEAFVRLVCQVTLSLFEPSPPAFRMVPVEPTPPVSGSSTTD